MERLNLHLASELSSRFDVRLVAPQGAAEHTTESSSVLEVPLRPLSCFLVFAMLRALWHAIIWRPNIIIGGSGLVAPVVFAAAKLCNAKSVVYTHGLDLAVPHRIYHAIWQPIFRRLDVIIANSHSTAQLASDIGVEATRIEIVHPGVDIPAHVEVNAPQSFRKKYELGLGPILLSVGRLTARKGIREFVETVLPIIVEQRSDTQLVVVGDEPVDSLYAEAQSIQSIKDIARSKGLERNVHFLGKRFGAELSEAYFAADVHVFPVRTIASDPEGFGMVAVESAAHGLATVAYATGGVVDAVDSGCSGSLVRPGDTEGFARAVLKLIETPPPKALARRFAERFAWTYFGDKLVAAIGKNK